MTLVAGIDSSTQSCKVVIRDAATGALVRHGSAPHPSGTEVDPTAWWDALAVAVEQAGGLADVAAISVGGQQHGMVVLDADGDVIRPALLWNDSRSGGAARDLVTELGAQAWAEGTGTVPVASITATKLRWLAQHEPENAARVAAVCLPHDYLTWRLSGSTSLDDLVTDASDASGTGYYSGRDGAYRRDLLAHAFGRDDVVLPRVAGPREAVGTATAFGASALLGPGAGDNAAAALALGLGPGDVAISLGTSGVVSAVVAQPVADASGTVAGFSDATGNFLPLVVTVNCAQVLDATRRVLGIDVDTLAALALAAPAGAGGVTLVPYLQGERTPNLPDATGALHGLTLESYTRENVARAAFEAIVCSLAVGIDAVRDLGLEVSSVRLLGGAAKSPALREVAPAVLGTDVLLPSPGEYVADGAARQAAWVLAAQDDAGADLPDWADSGAETVSGTATPHVREQYAAASGLFLSR
ncbi:xylulokinase [Serinibacter arcticus]|uniref:Xylulose kinase n=1 Tax=Serinibacter arcticus TaxID=1655435 RepID=A0A2U1ZY07_9MICO|nr:xylulokinase [Serinibacter arcticus]PWD51869.1 xylulokinase [Serinibacter arcticus]